MLLTRRAARLLATADVVVVDRRSLDPIVALAPAHAERIFVGRADGHPAWDTDAVADLLADRARNGGGGGGRDGRRPAQERRPVRVLPGRRGDGRPPPRGIHVEVTPGVSAATAAPLAAGMPRGRTVTILAGNDDPVYPVTDIGALADPDGTLVVLVGRARQHHLADALIAAGLDPSTPAAVVHAATRPGARTVHTTLEHLGAHRLPPPATVVIGPARAHP